MDNRAGSSDTVLTRATTTLSRNANKENGSSGRDIQSTAGTTTDDVSRPSAPESDQTSLSSRVRLLPKEAKTNVGNSVSSARATIGSNDGHKSLDFPVIGAQFGSGDTATVGSNSGRHSPDLVGIGAQFGSGDTVTATSKPHSP